jgi:hypothetical protein
MKTMKDWINSDIDSFDIFFLPGDIVGEDVVEYFRNLEIPKTDNTYLMQMGEPQNFIDGKSTYMTFAKENKGWVYKGNCHKGEKETPFEIWLNTFIEEKGIDISETFKSSKKGILMDFSYENVLVNIKSTSENEQEAIKEMLIKIDFYNGDIKEYLRHLSKALIPSPEEVQRMEEIYGESINLKIEEENEESI